MTDWQQISAELSKKLDPKHVKPAKSFGPKGDYIEGWHAMAEANRIFGHDGWSYTVTECTCVNQSPRAIGKEKKDGFGVTYTAKVSVNVLGVIREDFGAGHGYDVDCGLAHESAIKEAVTDALKRALRSFGNPFGLALYDKTRENVGAPEATPRDPEDMTQRIVKALEAAEALPKINSIRYSGHFKDHVEWVAKDHPDHAKRIKDAEDKALRRVDPAMQRPADEAA